jgi:DNA helicase-2/ATP-dependent DNA helicase PcrA
MPSDRPPLIGLEGLNSAQRAAVEHVLGPLLVVAGAGSGKTRVLTMRIARLIDQEGVPPSRIFAVTFTNKAAGEMKDRVGRLLGQDPSGLWIGTFHSLSARLLRREAEALGFTRQFTIYDEDDRLSLIRRLMEQRGHSTKLFPPKMVQALISAAKNRMTGPDELAQASPFDRLAQVAADIYRAMGPALKAQNAMDFDDLMLHPLTLFRERPDRLQAYQDRFAFLLVDEFQDTNAAQYQLVRQLGAKHQNVCAVGDDDQSIYGWRGADVRNMLAFQQDFPGTTLIRLEENYRSTKLVLDAANAVIAENKGRIGKTLRTKRGGGEAITVLAAADERDEAEWIVKEFRTRSAQGDWEWDQMAVLYRTNAQSRALEEAFRRSGVPYRIIGAISFYDRREVKDLLAYLRLVANPNDDEAFLRAAQVPKRGLGESSMAILQETATRWNRSLLATARTAELVPELRPNVRESLRKFAGLIDDLAERAGQWPPAQILEQVILATQYEQFLLAEGPEGADRWENVRELVASAAEWSEVVEPDEESGTPLERFLAEAALLSSHDSVQGAGNGVTLMTLHTAKGLEWPVVALAGMEDGLFPLARAEEQPDGLEEERRLCYVGITRAKDKLYLTWARARRRGGELRPGRPSRFLEALPPEVIEEKRTSSMWAPDWRGAAATRRPGWSSGAAVTGGSRRSWLDDDEPPSRAPAEAEPSQDAPRYVKGERVRHRRFGSGTIQGLTGAGKDLKVSVKFDDEEHGVKQLLVAYAGLEREWESA